MTNWPVHAAWNGPIVMIGFGSIGRGTLPLILRHIKCDPKLITVIDPDAAWTVDPAHGASRSRNTPFAGRRLRGRAVAVFVDGARKQAHA